MHERMTLYRFLSATHDVGSTSGLIRTLVWVLIKLSNNLFIA